MEISLIRGPDGKFIKGHKALSNSKFWLGKHHSDETKKKISESKKGTAAWNKGLKLANQTGEKHHNWKGGKYKDEFGYIYLYIKNHPCGNKRSYVFEHRLVMEKHLGRYLTKEEVVHHKNGVRDDNRLENLELLTNQSEHMKIHFRERNDLGQFI